MMEFYKQNVNIADIDTKKVNVNIKPLVVRWIDKRKQLAMNTNVISHWKVSFTLDSKTQQTLAKRPEIDLRQLHQSILEFQAIRYI